MTKNSDSTRFYSQKQETAVANFLNGRRQPNSGASNFSAGDVVVDSADMLIECKTTMSERNSFSIKKEWIEKNKNESYSIRKQNSAIAFRFSPDGEDYFVINKRLMRFLVEKLSEGEA